VATQARTASLPHAAASTGELSPTIVWLAALMDDAYEIPGTKYRIGLDAIIGLLPGIGDFATMIIGSLVLKEAKRLGVSRWTRTRMMANYGLDFLIGLIPVAGDLFDIGFKAHRKNLRLLQKHLGSRQISNQT
jgi:uncharacterized protein DUF4112